jgi:hypothetical protein
MVDDKEQKPTHYKCDECNELHPIPKNLDKEPECLTKHMPSVSTNFQATADVKLCQSCIERGYVPPKQATREWLPGVYYCDDCFEPLINNLTNVAPAAVNEVLKDVPRSVNGNTPLLDLVYKALNIPPELQFDKVDTVCRNHEKYFNFAAPAIVNKDLEELARQIEEFQCVAFIVRYVTEPHTLQIAKLKEERRKEKNLAGISDSAEVYSKEKKKKSAVVDKKLESMAKAMGMTVEQLQENMKKAREKDFNRLVGNCTECGEAKHDGPCISKPKEVAKPVQVELKPLVITDEIKTKVKNEQNPALAKMILIKELGISLQRANEIYGSL